MKALSNLLLVGVIWVSGFQVGRNLDDAVPPDPAPPTPIVDEVPVPGDGFHVLIIEETDERRQLPQSQLAAVTGTAVKRWMKNNGAEWRIWDQDVDAAHEDRRVVP